MKEAESTHLVLEILDDTAQWASLARETTAGGGTWLEERWLGDVVVGGG